MDQQYFGRDNRYFPTRTGRGVNVYVVDSGIWYSHQEFEGRAVKGFDAFSEYRVTGAPGRNELDCGAGHGTKTASIIGGKTTGIAKEATLYAVRINDCGGGTYGLGNGSGYQYAIGSVVAGIDWIARYKKPPAIANLGFVYYGSESFMDAGQINSLESAVKRLVATGVTVVTGAGNDSRSASDGKPARMPEVITAGAIDVNDYIANFSNYGPDVDIFAPGCCHRTAATGSVLVSPILAERLRQPRSQQASQHSTLKLIHLPLLRKSGKHL